MKTRAPALAATTMLLALAVIGLSCSHSGAPLQSVFVAEQGQWYWLQSVGGLNNDTVYVDSVNYYRLLQFTQSGMAYLGKINKADMQDSLYFAVPYWVEWETMDSERVRVLHYAGGVYPSQVAEFLGRDTLILTDMAVDGYTHSYVRVF